MPPAARRLLAWGFADWSASDSPLLCGVSLLLLATLAEMTGWGTLEPHPNGQEHLKHAGRAWRPIAKTVRNAELVASLAPGLKTRISAKTSNFAIKQISSIQQINLGLEQLCQFCHVC
jgi:hypothetical protein